MASHSHSPLLSRLLPPPHFFFLLLPWLLISLPNPVLSQCHHTPVIFSFGDSNSDTGGLVAGLGFPVNFPNGRTFFRRSTGRLSDGRLIIDLLCKSPHSTTTLSLFFIGYRGCEVGSDLPFTWLGVSVKARALNGIWCASWLINGADFAYGASFFFHRGGGRQCALVPYFKWSEFTRMCACT